MDLGPPPGSGPSLCNVAEVSAALGRGGAGARGPPGGIRDPGEPHLDGPVQRRLGTGPAGAGSVQGSVCSRVLS